MKLHTLVGDKLFDRITAIEDLVIIAKDLLQQDKDYLQCAVRLQEISEYIKFENITLDMFDAINQDRANTGLK